MALLNPESEGRINAARDGLEYSRWADSLNETARRFMHADVLYLGGLQEVVRYDDNTFSLPYDVADARLNGFIHALSGQDAVEVTDVPDELKDVYAKWGEILAIPLDMHDKTKLVFPSKRIDLATPDGRKRIGLLMARPDGNVIIQTFTQKTPDGEWQVLHGSHQADLQLATKALTN